jgi:hypothetical protein
MQIGAARKRSNGVVASEPTIDVLESFSSPADTSTKTQPESNIYSDFNSDVRWIKQTVRADLETLRPAMQGVAHYYLTNRIKVLDTTDHVCATHHLSPRPIPYLAFWYSHAFGLDDPQVRRLLGLCLVYACLSSTPRDDLLDGSGFAPRQQTYLSGWFWQKYVSALETLFDDQSLIWLLLAKSKDDWERCDRWVLSQQRHQAADPLSVGFLRNSSAYLAALIFPTLAGVALLSNRARKIAAIKRFTCHYCMGWRILDDWRDWRDDLEANIQTNSVLAFLRLRSGIPKRVPLTKQFVVSILSNQDVVNRIYSAMIGFCRAAWREAAGLQAVYVTRFIDEQLLGYEAELARIGADKENFQNCLARLLEASPSSSRALLKQIL